MKENISTTRCKSLSDFKTLVNYRDARTAEIMDGIQHRERFITS